MSTKSQEATANTGKQQTNTTKNSGSNSKGVEFDLVTPCWFYMDSNNERQGPFSFKDMYTWWKTGYFTKDLQVKTVWDNDFKKLENILLFHSVQHSLSFSLIVLDCPEFINIPPSLVDKIGQDEEEDEDEETSTTETKLGTSNDNVFYEDIEQSSGAVYQDYTVFGTFNPITGKFQSVDNPTYYGLKGLPADKDQRMMGHFFNYDLYASQMNSEKDKKKKVKVKGTKKFWKARKEEKKRRKAVAEYLKD